MIISKGLALSMIQSFLMVLKTNQAASSIILCTGTKPTDAEVDTLTTSSAIVTNSTAAVFNTAGLLYTLYNATEFPPRYVLSAFPTTNQVTASKTGTINWGVLVGPWGIAVVDVTVTNGGGILEVNTVDVVSGVTSVSLTNWSFKVGR